MKLVPVMALLLALAACDQSIDELEEQRNIWLASAPSDYAYTIQVAGWRSPVDVLHPKRVTVHVASTSAAYVWDSPEHDVGEPAGTYWSIDRVFDELIEAKRRNAYVRARFDEQRGFVERAFVDYDTDSSGWDVEIREFEDLATGALR
jgi:hypothetical protein